MNYLDRINQLNDEVAFLRSQIAGRVEELDAYKFANKQMSISIDEMRSQLFDARKQLEADSATIAKLSADKREACELLRDGIRFVNKGFEADDCDVYGVDHNDAGDFVIGAEAFLSRHA